jgi:hypothetical protein
MALYQYYLSVCGLSIGLASCSFNDHPIANLPNKSMIEGIDANAISRDTLNLTLMPTNDIHWNDIVMDTNQLLDCLFTFTDRSIRSGNRKNDYEVIGQQNQNNSIVFLNVYRSTEYGLYLRTKNKIDKASDSLSEIYSKIHFDKAYVELSTEEQKTIKSITSIKLLENPIKD